MKRSWYAAPYGVWMVLFTVVPLLFVLYYAFTDQSGAFTVNNFVKIASPMYGLVLWDSLRLAFFCTLLCLLIGYPTAYFLASRDFSNAQTLVVLILVPMWMNFLLRTYAMMTLLEDNGVLNTLLRAIGLPGMKMIGTEGAVLLGMVYNFLPFMILQINTSLCKMDHSLLEAAADLGADGVHTFLKVTLPLSLPGVISGISLVFLPAVSSFFIPKLLGGGQYFLIGNVIENQFITVGEWNFGSAISVIMAMIMMYSMYLVRHIEARNSGNARKES